MAEREVSSRLLELFLGELDERLRAFDSDLLILEAQPPAGEREAVVHRLFRGAHSLKGAASTVGATSIELVCHQLEDFLGALRDGLVALEPAHADVLLRTTDGLREAGRLLAEGITVGPGASQLVERLSTLTRTGERPTSAAPPIPPPVAPAEPVASVAPLTRVPRRGGTLRVAVERVEALLRQSGELLVARHRLGALGAGVTEAAAIVHRLRTGVARPEALHDLERSLERIASTARAERAVLEGLTTELDSGLRAIRMLPFATACEGLDRIVRDSAKAAGKTAVLVIEGGDVGIDRAIIERLRDPLVHLVRNAIDHGIEVPARRRSAGKAPGGVVRVSAAMHGSNIDVAVADDGCGIDRDELGRRARAGGFTVPEGSDIATIAFLPGVSTASAVTGLSGRGVGLDAVRAASEAMRGDVTVRSDPGKGTRFTLTLPHTLTTIRVVLFASGGQVYALNSAWVERFIRIDPTQVVRSGGRPMLLIGERAVPLVSFAEIVGERRDPSADLPRMAILADTRGVRLALAVDELIEERDVLVRPLGPRLSGLRLVFGASILADGSIALVLRGSAVAEEAVALTKRATSAPVIADRPAAKRVLLVDDSVTTRALERSILEAAGFDVLTAADGAAAWRILEGTDVGVDIVVSDVDMPEMDGFALVEAIRASQRLRDLPIILVTARESDADRQRGLEAGADAYITKSAFRQEALLEAIGELL